MLNALKLHIKKAAASPEEEQQRNRKVALVKLLAILIFFVLVIVFGSIAWFAANKESAASGMGVKVGTNDFELRVSGDNLGAKSYTQNRIPDPEDDEKTITTYSGSDILNFAALFSKYKNGTSSGDNFDTDSANPEIKWRLTADYDTKEDKGLGPGSDGMLTFWIVSKKEGTIDPTFSIDLEGYVAPNQQKNDNGSYEVDEADMSKITASSGTAYTALSYLSGHILFFNHRDGAGTSASPYTYTGLLDKESFTLSDVKGSVQTTHVGDTIRVDLYWVWPNTFGQMVLPKSENSNRTPIFTETDDENAENPENAVRLKAKADVQDYVLDHISTIFDLSKMSFAEGVATDAAKIAAVKELMATSDTVDDETVYTFDGEAVNSHLSELSSGYNNADQKIGTNVNYALIALRVQQ